MYAACTCGRGVAPKRPSSARARACPFKHARVRSIYGSRATQHEHTEQHSERIHPCAASRITSRGAVGAGHAGSLGLAGGAGCERTGAPPPVHGQSPRIKHECRLCARYSKSTAPPGTRGGARAPSVTRGARRHRRSPRRRSAATRELAICSRLPVEWAAPAGAPRRLPRSSASRGRAKPCCAQAARRASACALMQPACSPLRCLRNRPGALCACALACVEKRCEESPRTRDARAFPADVRNGHSYHIHICYQLSRARGR